MKYLFYIFHVFRTHYSKQIILIKLITVKYNAKMIISLTRKLCNVIAIT